jgi:DNA-directed RNA polymerase subunit RPC12/RpoP
MIQVSLTSLLLLGMACGVALLGVFWVVAVWRERRYESRVREDLVHCRICGHIYENGKRLKVTACPRCGSLNEAVKPKPI